MQIRDGPADSAQEPPSDHGTHGRTLTARRVPCRTAGPSAAPHGRLPADAAAARRQPADVGRSREHGAGRRPPAPPAPAERRRRRAGPRRARLQIGTIGDRPADGPRAAGPEHHRRGDGARPRRAVTVEGGIDPRTAGARAGRGPEERRSRRLHPAHPGARRSRPVAHLRACARNPPAGRRHRRSDAAGVPARDDARSEGGGEAAAPRGRSAAEEARAGALPADARSVGARAQRQDRVAGAAGDDRRAEAVLPAPADEGHPGGARRRRRQRDQGAARARRGRRACPITCGRSSTARSIAWRAWDRRRPSPR